MNRTTIVEKTSNPKWNQSAIFKASSFDVLTIMLYNAAAARDELLGVLKFPLDTLQISTSVSGWYELQAATQGYASVTITALNFGLTESCQTGRPLHQIDIGKSGKKVRKFRIPDKPQRPTISQKSSQVVASLRLHQKKPASFDATASSEQNELPNLLNLDTEESEGNNDENSSNEQSSTGKHSEKRGYLEKASGSSYKKGKQSRRWFVLKEDSLCMFKTPKEKSPMENFSLKDTKVSLEDLRIIIRNSKHKWDLYALTQSDAEDWVNSIRKNINLLEGNNENPEDSPVLSRMNVTASGNIKLE